MAYRHDEVRIDKAHQFPGGDLLLFLIEENCLNNEEGQSIVIFKFWSLLSINRIFDGQGVKLKFTNN